MITDLKDMNAMNDTAAVANGFNGSLSDPMQLFNNDEKYQRFFKTFGLWSETFQDSFVQQLLSHMSHYQHSRINTFLRPMLQRDFISLLPSRFCFVCLLNLKFMIKFFFTFRKRSRSCSRNYSIVFG